MSDQHAAYGATERTEIFDRIWAVLRDRKCRCEECTASLFERFVIDETREARTEISKLRELLVSIRDTADVGCGAAS